MGGEGEMYLYLGGPFGCEYLFWELKNHNLDLKIAKIKWNKYFV